MTQYIDKAIVVAEIEKMKNKAYPNSEWNHGYVTSCEKILSFLDTLEVKDPYEQCIQYASIECGIKAHAEDYSFNIESELFNQLTKQQQALWRKEIEQACISGGYSGLNLAKDPRYKENLKVKEVDLEKELNDWRHNHFHGRRDKEASGEYLERVTQLDIAKHFYELGINASNPLTFEDIRTIDRILDGMRNENQVFGFPEGFYNEALKRFKAQKGEEV